MPGDGLMVNKIKSIIIQLVEKRDLLQNM